MPEHCSTPLPNIGTIVGGADQGGHNAMLLLGLFKEDGGQGGIGTRIGNAAGKTWRLRERCLLAHHQAITSAFTTL